MTLPPGLVYLTRADWGAPATVYSTDGKTPRPALARPARWLTVHYTGNSRPLTTGDRAAVIAAQQGLERFAQGAGKSNEYNWVLYDAAGTGYIVEYAGGFQAAHSAGENDQAVGVLFWVAVDQPATDAMVTAYRWLRDGLLRPGGAVGAATLQTPHRDMPGAATPCPGPVLDRWSDLLQPYTNGGDMPERMLVRNGNRPNTPDDTAWHGWIVSAGGKFWVPTNEALAIATAELGAPVDVTDDWMRAHGPVIGPNPTADPYGVWTG